MSDALEALEQFRKDLFPDPNDERDVCAEWIRRRWKQYERIIRAALEQGEASTADQWKPSGAEYDRNIHHNTDASAWADFFMATFPNCGADRDMMLGWFANAMMAVADSRPSTAEAQARALVGIAMEVKQMSQRTSGLFSEGLLTAARYAEAEAKRIREEAK